MIYKLILLASNPSGNRYSGSINWQFINTNLIFYFSIQSRRLTQNCNEKIRISPDSRLSKIFKDNI